MFHRQALEKRKRGTFEEDGEQLLALLEMSTEKSSDSLRDEQQSTGNSDGVDVQKVRLCH